MEHGRIIQQFVVKFSVKMMLINHLMARLYSISWFSSKVASDCENINMCLFHKVRAISLAAEELSASRMYTGSVDFLS